MATAKRSLSAWVPGVGFSSGRPGAAGSAIGYLPQRRSFDASLRIRGIDVVRLGLDGVITGMGMYPDLMARIWALHEQGNTEKVRDAYSKFLLMRNVSQQIPGSDLYLFKKRGIFKTMATRTGGAAAWKVKTFDLAADEIAEVDYRFAALAPYLQVNS